MHQYRLVSAQQVHDSSPVPTPNPPGDLSTGVRISLHVHSRPDEGLSPYRAAPRQLTSDSDHDPLGSCQYVKMPLGLMDSSAVFQHCIWETLEDCPGYVPYIDDILVYGKTKQEHDQNLEQVLRALHACNFHLSYRSVSFARRQSNNWGTFSLVLSCDQIRIP